MRPWLEGKLDSRELEEQLYWKEVRQTFAVKWKHAARHGYNATEDATVFKAWAIHTGAYQDGDEANPNRWKANFRCALHSLTDVEEVTEPGQRRGHNAARIYRFLEEPKVKKGRRSKKNKKNGDNGKSKLKEEKEEASSSGERSLSNGETTIIATTMTIPVPSLPDFQQLISNSKTTFTSSSNFYAGGSVTVMNNAEQTQPHAVWKGMSIIETVADSTSMRVRTPSGDSGLCSSPSSHGSDVERLDSIVALLSSASSDSEDTDYDEGVDSAEDSTLMDEFVAIGTQIQGPVANWSTVIVPLEEMPFPDDISEPSGSVIAEPLGADMDDLLYMQTPEYAEMKNANFNTVTSSYDDVGIVLKIVGYLQRD